MSSFQKPNSRQILAAILALASVAVFLFSIYLDQKSRNQFEDLTSQIQETTSPPETTGSQDTAPETQPPVATEPQMLSKYVELYARNPEFFGWICIPDTPINYPVMHSPKEPDKYLHGDFDGNYTEDGTPFLQYDCKPDSDNLLIHGHNMLDGTMFNSLHNYEEEEYWREHPTFLFDTLYEEQEYEILAVFHDKVYYRTDNCFKFYDFIDAKNKREFNEAITYFKEHSFYETGVTAEYGDKLVSLVTCSYHSKAGRLVVVGVKK